MSSELLFRVFDNRSIVGLDTQNGFTAAALTPFDPSMNPVSAKADVEAHANWGNKTPTPLISTTSDYKQAARFAQLRELRGCGDVRIAIIDDSKLTGVVKVYRMLDLVKTLDARIIDKARNESEYVCVHRIPKNAIQSVYTVREFKFYVSNKG